MSFRVVPYEEKYAEGLRDLDRRIVQGKHIRLQILKDHFLDRARVFQSYGAFVVLNAGDVPIGSVIGARVPIMINGVRHDAGLGFDLKVDREYRNRGIARSLSKTLFDEVFEPAGLVKRFTTIKKSNMVIRSMLARAVRGLWFHEFVYLTIPAGARIHRVVKTDDKQPFRVTLFDEREVRPSWYTHKPSGLAYFNTQEMYQLRITGISMLYRVGIRMLKIFNAPRLAHVPRCGDCLSFATLFNHTHGNILMINEILAELRTKGVGYLMVCCRRGDAIYRTLKDHSINTYAYSLVTNFPVSDGDAVTVDVRCL